MAKFMHQVVMKVTKATIQTTHGFWFQTTHNKLMCFLSFITIVLFGVLFAKKTCFSKEISNKIF
jgi:hypothetical protein